MGERAPQVGKKAPDFTVETTDGRLSLADLLQSGKLVLAFYAEDATPLCASQVVAFSEDYEMVGELGARVLAVSADSLESHRAFEQALGGLPFPLASDSDLSLARAYNVLDDSGKRSRRAVFVIDRDGTLLQCIDQYNPNNSSQYEDVFRALGMDV
jgi:peroxiredoxin Q/BCP